jgi:hypothetical protein
MLPNMLLDRIPRDGGLETGGTSGANQLEVVRRIIQRR